VAMAPEEGIIRKKDGIEVCFLSFALMG